MPNNSMLNIAALVDSLGGLAQKQQLVALGARDLDLTRAVREGGVHRARQGWYTTFAETDARVRAVRVGGRLTGISAVIQLGGWALGRHPLHVSVADNAARLRSQHNRRVRFDTSSRGGVVVHWDAKDVMGRGTAASVDLIDALVRVIIDEPLETAVAALDWALRTGAIERIDFERLLLRLPHGYRQIRQWVVDHCDSLPESLARTRLRLRGHSVSSQRRLGDLERIDLVVDDCVSVECDGAQFHVTRFERDRRKDMNITLDTLYALRPTANMIFREWDLVLAAIEAAVSMHVRAPAYGNSGLRMRPFAKIPATRRRRRRQIARSPEFPK
jgi:very-short-patch-repair endonuclease